MPDYFLTTDRIGFSVWTEADRELALSLWGSPDVTRLICASGRFTRQEVFDRLALEVDNYRRHGVQYFPIFDRSGGDLIGCCGLRPFGEKEGAYELGFHLRRAYWGRGLAREAGRAMVRHAFSTLCAGEIHAGHNPENHNSRKVLLKLGFRYVEDLYYPPTGLYHPSYLLSSADHSGD